ncbi:TIGR03086 family protein [Streptomyces sp. NBC_00083]|uniref:TIGR03086 family protein n=1 Tax=Streptomyces sp. NBC_00083 TaxID=2975647 RepID=UPI00225895D1|nr:TIGR03086 family protein [Streptomyces sp. NBC_00083]MCX5384251.1 TIGR03086 family protein [Streptomyces sp. NBC_00083]
MAIRARPSGTTAQHRRIAAAAAGRGERPEPWRAVPAGADAVARHLAACALVVDAFAAVDSAERSFALPEFGAGAAFPAGRAIGFHLVDYVVHGWNVARSLGLPCAPDAGLLEAALPLALAVPDGGRRLEPGAPFRPALTPHGAAHPLDRILTALGRSPQWSG